MARTSRGKLPGRGSAGQFFCTADTKNTGRSNLPRRRRADRIAPLYRFTIIPGQSHIDPVFACSDTPLRYASYDRTYPHKHHIQSAVYTIGYDRMSTTAHIIVRIWTLTAILNTRRRISRMIPQYAHTGHSEYSHYTIYSYVFTSCGPYRTKCAFSGQPTNHFYTN